MENSVKQVIEYFETVNVTRFCERYGLRYDHLRQALTGRRLFSEKLLVSVLQAMQQYEADQQEKRIAIQKNIIAN